MKFTLNFVFMKIIIFILLFLPCIAIANMDSLTISLLGNRISTTDSIMENLFPQNIEEIENEEDGPRYTEYGNYVGKFWKD